MRKNLTSSLSTARQQVVFALLVPSCQQVWNKLLTTCNNLVDIIVFVTRLFQQVQYSHDITILLQVVTGLQTSCYKSVHKLSTSCVRTACSQLS